MTEPIDFTKYMKPIFRKGEHCPFCENKGSDCVFSRDNDKSPFCKLTDVKCHFVDDVDVVDYENKKIFILTTTRQIMVWTNPIKTQEPSCENDDPAAVVLAKTQALFDAFVDLRRKGEEGCNICPYHDYCSRVQGFNDISPICICDMIKNLLNLATSKVLRLKGAWYCPKCGHESTKFETLSDYHYRCVECGLMFSIAPYKQAKKERKYPCP